jgi:acetolactate synthase regulatory subunit
MTFKATALSASVAFDRIRTQAKATKDYLTTQRTAMVQATVPSERALAVIQHFGQVVAIMDALAATPGLAEYAKAQVNDPAYDVAAEYIAMRNAMVAARDDLMGRFPKDGGGFLLYQTLTIEGVIQHRTFTAAQMAPVVTLMDAVIATID